MEGGSEEREEGLAAESVMPMGGELSGRDAVALVLRAKELLAVAVQYLPRLTGVAENGRRGAPEVAGAGGGRGVRELLAYLPRALREPRSRKRRACLRLMATHAGASNEQIRKALAIKSPGQVSRMLGCLLEAGLLVKVPGRRGTPNAWSLSRAGEEVLPLLDALHAAERG